MKWGLVCIRGLERRACHSLVMFGRLLLLFILVPLVDLMLLLKVGARIGFVPTLGIVIVTAILGASLTRSQGVRTLRKLQEAQAEGRMPHAELLEGVMILIAGIVLLTPGFLTDLVGFLLLIPPVRTALRGQLGKALKGRVQVVGMSPGGQVGAYPQPQEEMRERVIEAKVIEVNAESES